jgi:hypothetical protein
MSAGDWRVTPLRRAGLASRVLDLRIRRTASSEPSRLRSRELTFCIFQDNASVLPEPQGAMRYLMINLTS